MPRELQRDSAASGELDVYGHAGPAVLGRSFVVLRPLAKFPKHKFGHQTFPQGSREPVGEPTRSSLIRGRRPALPLNATPFPVSRRRCRGVPHIACIARRTSIHHNLTQRAHEGDLMMDDLTRFGSNQRLRLPVPYRATVGFNFRKSRAARGAVLISPCSISRTFY